MITSVLDAHPLQVARVGTPTAKPMLAAATLGGVFILTTYHLYAAALACGVAALAAILWWLWTGTSIAPEKVAKPIGRGIVLPLYSSGPASPGWWAMFITMTADATAFASLIFGYFFYWTIHADFPPGAAPGLAGPGVRWPVIALVLFIAGWLLTVFARESNARGYAGRTRAGLALGALATAAGRAAKSLANSDTAVLRLVRAVLSASIARECDDDGVVRITRFEGSRPCR